MNKLFDETFVHSPEDSSRTIWYGYFDFNLNEDLKNNILKLVKEDLLSKIDFAPSASHWIFYSSKLDGDAVEDKVRFSIMVRKDNEKFHVNINMSDFLFVTKLKEILSFKENLGKELNFIE